MVASTGGRGASFPPSCHGRSSGTLDNDCNLNATGILDGNGTLLDGGTLDASGTRNCQTVATAAKMALNAIVELELESVASEWIDHVD
jgi:hypothetical protein